MSTAKFDTLQNAAGTVSVPVNTVVNGSAKAWVNFNGTGTVAIRAAFNVSSITDNGTGDYTVNFTTAMPDTNYAVTQGASDGNTVGASGMFGFKVSSMATTAVRGLTGWNGAADASLVFVSIFR